MCKNSVENDIFYVRNVTKPVEYWSFLDGFPCFGYEILGYDVDSFLYYTNRQPRRKCRTSIHNKHNSRPTTNTSQANKQAS